jgi:hypothetical protein
MVPLSTPVELRDRPGSILLPARAIALLRQAIAPPCWRRVLLQPQSEDKSGMAFGLF